MTDIAKPDEVLHVAAGDVVAGKYRVEYVLGRGAMGVVVSARHIDLGQKVAVKLLHPDVSASEDGLERFLREARAAAKLESDHVARVFDVGTFGDKNGYMVMEHLEGSDLEKYLDTHGALPIAEAVDYVMEALEALAHAHAHGMVHRDIKPSNLFLTERVDGTRRVKILDFGISKTESGLGVSSPGSSTLTSPHAVLGSPAYMAPEQIRSSKHVDQRADIWSVGVMLYELVTGKSPFLGETVGDTLSRVLVGRPEPLSTLRPDAPRELVAVIDRCLESDEKRRFQSVGELASALAPMASPRTKDLPLRITRVLGANAVIPPPRAIVPSDPGVRINVAAETMAVADSASPKGTQITATSNRGAAEPSRSSRPFIALGIAAVGALVIVGVVMNQPAPPPPPPMSSDSMAPTMGKATNPPPLLMPATSAPVIAEPGPVVVPVAASQAPSAASSVASPPMPTTSPTIPLKSTATSSKKTTPPPNSTYPSDLLNGRD